MYVGITGQTTDERWRVDGSGYKRCPAFWHAIQKYGWGSFEHFIFASNITKEEAENMERLLIAKLNTQHKEFGYNIMEGGSAPSHTDETKAKISESHMGEKNPMYGRKFTDEEKAKYSKRFSGESNPRYGAIVTEETRKKISESQKGKHLSDDHKRKISEACKGKLTGRKRPEGGGRPPIRVRCVETNIEYGSINEAARENGVQKSGIRIALKNPNRTANSYHWEYA